MKCVQSVNWTPKGLGSLGTSCFLGGRVAAVCLFSVVAVASKMAWCQESDGGRRLWRKRSSRKSTLICRGAETGGKQ
eukprot:scaffold2358_cov160-Amphora_coffeaeformis.AAC.2